MPSTITPLATLTPPSNSRAWSSQPHPHLPIVATACSDKTVRIYSLTNFAQQSTVSGGHKRSIRSCAWKPNSVGESVLATGSFDASAGIWRRWEEGAGSKAEAAREMDFTSGLAGGDGGGEKDGDDAEDEEWRFAVVLDGHDSEIKSLGFAPTAPLLATCSRDKSVWIWEELEDDNFETVAVLQEHEGDVKCVAWSPAEELLASGSYDDQIRLWREDVDDWACCAVLEGHGGTVWWVEFEGAERVGALAKSESLSEAQKNFLQGRDQAGPRLASCSDDMSIRIWKRIPKDKPVEPTGQGKMPTIWKNKDFNEEWVLEAKLPQVHERAIYALSWSKKSGRIVSTGSDGKIVVYEERWLNGATDDVEMRDASSADAENASGSLTEWVTVAVTENAHDVFEVNHAVWAPRADKDKTFDGEEVIVTTGDDGEVKVWTIDG
jgi:WD40 repeat protein